MRLRGKLSAKFLILSLSLLAVALVSIGLTHWVTRQLDGGAAAVNEAGRIRMQTWRLVSAAQLGRPEAEIHGLLDEFDRSLALLRDGDPHRPLFVPWNERTQADFQALTRTWEDLRGYWQAPAPIDPERLRSSADAFVSGVDALVLGIEGTMERLTAGLNMFQLVMMALAVAGAVLLLYVSDLFVLKPLERLNQGLRRVESGDLSARVDVDSEDEFGEVASGFNHMAGTLQAMYRDLEAKVRSKTLSLEAQRMRLAALYEVSTFLAENHSLEELAQGFASKIRRFSRADAVAVRWSDEARQRYVLLASDCLPDEMQQQERCVVAGTCACGQVEATGGARVIPIVPERSEGDHFRHCAKAGYSTLVSVPIRLQHRILGEIDLFHRGTIELTDEERGLYDALASHLASAVENLRTEALLREAAASEERALLARELHDSIAQSLVFLRIQLGLLKAALERGDQPAVAGALGELEVGIRESTNDVRELLVHFRTRTNSDDIEQALRATLRKFEHQSGLTAHLEVNGHGVALPSDIQLQVLHVVQEALSNVRKHAQASEVWLTVDKEPRWSFSVRDNGRGFVPSAVGADDTHTHVGLQIMRERAARIGARVEVASMPGEGSRVLLELPL